MLILSDITTNGYSFEEPVPQQQQGQQNNTIARPSSCILEIYNHVYFGRLPSSLTKLQELDIRMIINCCEGVECVLKSIKSYNNLNTNSILMFIIDENFNIDSFTGNELDVVVEFQNKQKLILQEINRVQQVIPMTDLFITDKPLITRLQRCNEIVQSFQRGYPHLSVLLNYQGSEDITSVMTLTSLLLCLNPKSNITSSFVQVQNTHVEIDSNLLLNYPQYKDVLLQIWQLPHSMDDKRRCSDDDDDDLKRKKL